MLQPSILPAPSAFLVASFALLGVAVAAAFPLLVHRAERALGADAATVRRRTLVAAAAAALWLAATGAAAAAGQLTFTGTPPTMLLAFPVVIGLGLAIGLSPLGGRLAAGVPLAVLVGLQGFRFPLELAMHRAYTEGLMPVQMSFSGRNLDVLTGLGALLLAPLVAAGRAPRWLVLAWNAMGTLLLANILAVAALSTPTALRAFTNEPANVFVTQWPFVWLPAVLVLTAVWGHVVVFRALRVPMSVADGRVVRMR